MFVNTGKIGNIHYSRFSSVTVKTCDVTMHAVDECKSHSGRPRKHWIETIISKLTFNPFSFTLIILMDYNSYLMSLQHI